MYRFRKWSDPRRTQVPESVRSNTTSSRNPTQPSESRPALPPISDFRTSLILPGLSRRFTLLRSSSGDPVSLDDLKSRLAEQRARGAENHLSEEEEDMFLQTLGRLRSKPSSSSTSGDSTYGPSRDSVRSGETFTSSVTSSPASNKRYSNNMFGSGKFKDYTYLRSVAKERSSKVSAGRRSATSTALSISSPFGKSSDTSIPEESSQIEPDPTAHDSDTTLLVEPSTGELEQSIIKTFQPGHLRRASIAVEEVIRELEEVEGDGDDEILIPRSPAPERASSFNKRSSVKPTRVPLSESSVYETGTAVSPDPRTQTDAAEFRSTPSPYPRAETSPTPRFPGYIPGMPRPMTPRDATFEPDEVPPSSSSTPRATSPRIPTMDRGTSPNLPSGVLRRDSTSMRQPHRASSPISTNIRAPIASRVSGVNGHITPDHSRTPDVTSIEFGNPVESSLLGRRRPVSPFSSGTYQSMTVSSRPSTPSNVTWKAPSTPGSGGGQSRSGSAMGFSELDFAVSGLPSPVRNGFDRPSTHNRSDSNMSSNDPLAITQLGRSGSVLGSRSLRSPALPDSPVLEQHNISSIGALTLPKRSQPPSNDNDLNSSRLANAGLRSSTPTQYPPRSPPASPAFSEHEAGRSSRRGSRQATASPFALNQSQTLILSPIANSSRSSLESAGSSYHTWEADKQDRTLPHLAALDPQPPAWHDLSVQSNPAADGDVEDMMQQYSGLGKGDLIAVQERLIFAAKSKAEAPEPRERRNSLRKRRPSTSQSVNGRDSATTDVTQQGSPQRPTLQENAITCLDSVSESIRVPRSKMPGTPSGLRTDTDVVASPSAEPEPSSATRRKNALARALFGASDSEQSLTPPSPQLTDGPIVGSGGFASERSPLIESSASLRSLRETISPTTYAVNASVVNASATELPDKQLQLAREVQRRTEEAMAQLKKTPSNPKVNDGSHRKRIDLSQISGPKLVSASTSVDAIPVRSASVTSGHLSASQAQSANSAKLGTRFKKFRGSLRARPATSPSSEESTQHPFEPASTDRSLAGTPDGPHSAIELSRARISVPSPPATTGPGLKGFVSRFLKPRSGDMPEQGRRKRVPSSASTLDPPSYFGPQKIEQRHERTEPHQGIRSAPPDNKSFRPHTPVSPEEPPSPPIPPPSAQSPAPDESASRAVDENALKQFIDAANNLGLDQDALSEFLGRSTSVGSRLTVQGSKHKSVVSNDKPGNDNGNLALSEPAPLFGTGSSGARYSVGQPSLRPGDIIGKAPIRRPSTRNTTTSDANNAVVRRTLIFPAEARQSVLEPGMGLRKSSSTRRRRSASAASTHSNRSLHDRVPTPPPPKSSAARRFSAEQSPPLPLIPNSLMAQTQAISTPPPTSAIPLEKSNSAYDSLYDMYTGDGKPANAEAQLVDNSGSNSGPTLQNLEPGTAVEVLELANGETIWSIVNGLRDDDEESFYGNRASFVSEYSLRDNDGMQVFFKEHGRTGSKDSQASFLSRKKATQGPKRPETKVFFSSSTQIGRLIDNLSQGADSGSFNILPNASNGASSPSDSMHWTVEERLEHMLNSLGTA